jgi:hypothetical protein
MRYWRAAVLLAGLFAPAAHAQFSLYQVSGNGNLPVGQMFAFGGADPNQPKTATFLLSNGTNRALTLSLLSVSGVGFSLAGATAPVTLQAGSSVQFTVTFQAATVAYYSGALNATGVSVLLTAYVAQGITYEVQLASGTSSLGAAPVDFGTVQVGSSTTVNFLAVNSTAATLTVGPISVALGDFALIGSSPGGTSLAPQASASFSIRFSPAASGARTAALSIGSQQFTLTGTALAPSQFSLYQISGNAQLPVGAQFSFPTAYPNVPASVTFGILNTSSQTQTMTALSVSGAGFSLTGPAAPMSLPVGASAQFTITFVGANIGTYSGSLDAAGISVALAVTVTAPSGQFSLFQVTGSGNVPVASAFSFGSVYPNTPASVTLGLLNITSQTQTVTALSVSGAGFSTNAAAPMTVKAGNSVQFTVTFAGATTGNYSGTLAINSIAVALTANVTPGLTYEVQTASGTSALGAAAVNFGSVQVGSNTTVSFLAVNQTTATLTVDAIGVATGDFALVGPRPSGTSLDPQASAGFSIAFSPAAAGARTAVLSIGSRQFTLTGTGTSPPLPTPELSVTLGEAQSAQQGSVAVSFDAAAEAGGSGTVTLSFEAPSGAVDPGIVFAAGGRTVTFTFNKGDTAASFGGAGSAAFQTGTTAGTLMLAAQIGSSVSQKNVVIAPAAIGVAAVTGARQTSGLTVNVTGFDNTRTAGKLSFTFYNSAGSVILPGAIGADSTAAFSSYFAGSGDGGQFALGAYFPVNGDPSKVSAFTVQLANSAGTVTTARVNY